MNLQSGLTTGLNYSSNKEFYVGLLRNNTLRIDFTKKDGTERSMLCTLKADLIPYTKDETKESKPRKPDELNLTVWDIEKEGFRKIQISNITKAVLA